MNKYDDTDYQLEREESIEYEEIMSEEAFNDLIDSFEVVETLTVYGRKAIKQNVKKLQKRIKELEEENKRKDMFVEMAKEVIENSILKQKVKDKIKELEKAKNKTNKEHWKYNYTLQIAILKELLEESK